MITNLLMGLGYWILAILILGVMMIIAYNPYAMTVFIWGLILIIILSQKVKG